MGGTIEHAPNIVSHQLWLTTRLSDRTNDAVSLDEIERILIWRADSLTKVGHKRLEANLTPYTALTGGEQIKVKLAALSKKGVPMDQKRLDELLEQATVDCYDEEEEFTSVLNTLDDSLSFP